MHRRRSCLATGHLEAPKPPFQESRQETADSEPWNRVSFPDICTYQLLKGIREMTKTHVDRLLEARERAVADRRALAAEITKPYERGREQLHQRFVELPLPDIVRDA